MSPLREFESFESIADAVMYQATERGDAAYLLAARGEGIVTFRQLSERAKIWHHAMSAPHPHESERWGIMVSDPLEFAVCFIGLMSAGILVAPLDPTATNVNAELFQERLVRLRLHGVVSDRPAPPGTVVEWITTVDAFPERNAGQSLTSKISSGGLILSSSGTTGTPKVVTLSANQLLRTAHLVAHHHELGPNERGLNPLPLWHVNAEVVGLLATLVAGASLVVDERFHRTDFWAVAERHNVTWINAVPAIIARLVTLREGELVPSGIRFVRSASAPLSPAIIEQFESVIGINIVESYGMTEAASQICANPVDGPRKIGSVGPPVGVELRITPTDDVTLETESRALVGHVEVRGVTVITAYDAPGYENRFDSSGWLRTGDLGYLDEDGYLYIVGRTDDVINRGGEKIFPREIEEVVERVKGILEASVIGVPDDVFGQVPVLFVTLDETVEGRTPSTLESIGVQVNDMIVANFARTRRPVIIHFVDAMPAHAIGKVQKRQLAAGSVPIIYSLSVK